MPRPLPLQATTCPALSEIPFLLFATCRATSRATASASADECLTNHDIVMREAFESLEERRKVVVGTARVDNVIRAACSAMARITRGCECPWRAALATLRQSRYRCPSTSYSQAPSARWMTASCGRRRRAPKRSAAGSIWRVAIR
jgi:hypothetical protein